MPLEEPAWRTQSPEVSAGKENRCGECPGTQGQTETGRPPLALSPANTRDRRDSPQQELGRVVKAEHVVVILHVILIQQRVQLPELRDQTSVLPVMLGTSAEATHAKSGTEVEGFTHHFGVTQI